MAFAFLEFRKESHEPTSQTPVPLTNVYELKGLPCRVNTRWLRLVQPRHIIPLIESHNQSTDTKRPDATALRVPLLHAGHIFRDVLNGDGVLDGQAVRLGLYPGLVDEDAGVGVEPRKGETDVVVDEADLGRGDADILELHGGALLAAQDDDVLALDTHSASSWHL